MMKDRIREILLKPEHRDAVTEELIDDLYVLFLKELLLAEVRPFTDIEKEWNKG